MQHPSERDSTRAALNVGGVVTTLEGSLLPERGDRIDPSCAQRRNQRGTYTRRDAFSISTRESDGSVT
jgi:hypothetical protein